jgi:hypothetical protein
MSTDGTGTTATRPTSAHSPDYRFVSTGMSLDFRSFVTSLGTLAWVRVFLAALLIARAVPALLYRPLLTSRRQVMTAGLVSVTVFLVIASALTAHKLVDTGDATEGEVADWSRSPGETLSKP